ncbi:anti-sigma factor [Chelatococcus sambhunathii]|uniref:anti-sigma factor n=1 Tax=Chelatococcus sambhunathii TaxID=363953 RepID=UPI002852B1A0|nr:anti-sigma factor [Chelatococcus sambhunathii]
MSSDDPILASELDAYVDGELSAERRIEVEAWLAAHPELASRVMADLKLRNEMRRMVGEPAPLRPETERLARRLESGILWRRRLVFARRAAVILLLIGFGWAANSGLGSFLIGRVSASTQPPAYVSEAVMSQRTAQLRAEMKSQIETPDYDRDEIRAATAIVMPELPADWKVADVQVFPSDFGPSVQMAINSTEFGLLSLFAVRPGQFAFKSAVGQQIDRTTAAAYWQVGEVAYVLVGNVEVGRLKTRAERFAGTLGNGQLVDE